MATHHVVFSGQSIEVTYDPATQRPGQPVFADGILVGVELVDIPADPAMTLEEVHAAREARYRAEADPLYLRARETELVSGVVDYSAWLAKKNQIRLELPEP